MSIELPEYASGAVKLNAVYDMASCGLEPGSADEAMELLRSISVSMNRIALTVERGGTVAAEGAMKRSIPQGVLDLALKTIRDENMRCSITLSGRGLARGDLTRAIDASSYRYLSLRSDDIEWIIRTLEAQGSIKVHGAGTRLVLEPVKTGHPGPSADQKFDA